MASSLFSPVDSEGHIPIIDFDDFEMIQGHRYSAFWRATISSTAGGCIIAISSNEEKRCTVWASVEVDKSGVYEMYENAVISSGTILTAFNNERESIESADCIITGDPNISTTGTFIGSHIIGSTTGGASKSGGSSQVNKWRIKKNTTYLFKFIADADSTRVTHGLYWRECHA